MELHLDEDELAVLRAVLGRYLPELREEVYKTENYDLRQALKKDEEVVKALIERVGGVPAQS
ncbi:MAG TPA: hypothetical protein VH951_13890 [Dehalococcoidia bacterium]